MIVEKGDSKLKPGAQSPVPVRGQFARFENALSERAVRIDVSFPYAGKEGSIEDPNSMNSWRSANAAKIFSLLKSDPSISSFYLSVLCYANEVLNDVRRNRSGTIGSVSRVKSGRFSGSLAGIRFDSKTGDPVSIFMQESKESPVREFKISLRELRAYSPAALGVKSLDMSIVPEELMNYPAHAIFYALAKAMPSAVSIPMSAMGAAGLAITMESPQGAIAFHRVTNEEMHLTLGERDYSQLVRYAGEFILIPLHFAATSFASHRDFFATSFKWPYRFGKILKNLRRELRKVRENPKIMANLKDYQQYKDIWERHAALYRNISSKQTFFPDELARKKAGLENFSDGEMRTRFDILKNEMSEYLELTLKLFELSIKLTSGQKNSEFSHSLLEFAQKARTSLQLSGIAGSELAGLLPAPEPSISF